MNDKKICYKVRDKIIFSAVQLIQFQELLGEINLQIGF
jgi:hypothetical protein